MEGFIDSPAEARKEFKAMKRRAKRSGVNYDPVYAAFFRRDSAKRMLETAKAWRTRGEMDVAIRVARTARGCQFLALLIEGRIK